MHWFSLIFQQLSAEGMDVPEAVLGIRREGGRKARSLIPKEFTLYRGDRPNISENHKTHSTGGEDNSVK